MSANGKLRGEDIAAWAMNVTSCVAIIMINKQLMAASGYGFNYATTLCGFHFMVTGAASKLYKMWTEVPPPTAEEDIDGKEKPRSLPIVDLVTFVIIANVSIVSLNTSLMINHVSMYQIAKLGIPPLSACIERAWFGNTYSTHQIGAMIVTLIGVSLVTVAEFSIQGDTLGVTVAGISIVASSLQQILCGYYQKKNRMSSNDFLSAVSTWQGICCLICGPFIDYGFTKSWVTSYEFNSGSMTFLVLSCLASVIVNASHFICLGRFSAVSYQILGHTKTVMVLVLGYYFFGGVVRSNQVVGGILAIMGMAAYGYYTQKLKAKPPASPRSPRSPRTEL
eukprot:TRINITY_DN3044_c0_g1_i1.p1 TRINITY_DN3044_c0_g1~~TRINITY_DN3044_c0_g1_i1.p1  ORF type:complete len:351 (+),score=54.62 TRINITY_DN3044_c0_g1_i1:46-1053(+)